MRFPGRDEPLTRRLAVVTAALALVLTLASLGATSSWGPVLELIPRPPAPPPTEVPSPPPIETLAPPEENPFEDFEPSWVMPAWVGELLQALAIAAGVVLLGWFIWRVRKALEKPELRRAHEATTGGVALPDELEAEVATSLSDAIAALRSGVAVDDAVVACWRRLEAIAADSGVERRPTQTAQEFTVAILGHAVVDEAALSELASLYRRALFSTHQMGEADRDRAVEALESVAASLGVGDDA